MSFTTISLDAAKHPVTSVTIFQSSTAELKRTFTVDLKGGSNVLEISGISSHVDRESPRIHGLGTDARVVDIACNTTLVNVSNHSNQRRSKHSAAIKDLSAKRKLLEAERNVRQNEFDLLDDAARSLVQDKGIQFDAFMDAFVVRKRNAMRSVIEKDQEIEELDKEIWLLKNTHKGDTTVVVVATLLAKRDCKVEFQLTYLVTGVTWQPYYDLHATTSDGKPSSNVSLHYCANITQGTGEDWSNTVLTLSTSNSHALRSLTVPKVDPLRLMPTVGQSAVLMRSNGLFGQPFAQRLQQQQQQQQQQSTAAFGQPAQTSTFSSFGQQQQPPTQTGFGAFGQASVPAPQGGPGRTGGFGLFGNAPAPPPPPPAGGPAPAPRAALFGAATTAPTSSAPAPSFEEDEFEDIGDKEGGDAEEGAPGAVLDKNPLALAYRVEGRVSLPSDGVAHKVSLAVLDFAATLKYVCVPRKTSAAFIEGRIKNTSEYELLAGPVSVFMDDSFVTKTLLGLIGVNESFGCVLGIDAALKVSYHTKSRTEHEPKRSFAEPTKTTTRTVTTTISNGHAFDLAGLVVRDAIPLGNDDAHISIALRRPVGLAEAKDGEDVVVKGASSEGQGQGQDVKVRWARTESGAGGEKEGLLEWVCEVKAGKKVRLEAEWDVKSPGNVRWEEVPNFPFGRGKKE